jgi:diguanylate cyclase (GGDEF)-like protein/PAS domain S-box-containing protein
MVQITGLDPERDYRARQIRLGIGTAVAATVLAIIRIAADWPAHQWWWLLVTGLAVAVQLPLVRLPWYRLAGHPRLERWLFAWWLAEVGMLLAFCVRDDAGTAVFAIGAALISASAGSTASPRTVLTLGAVSIGGYLAVLSAHPQTDLSLAGLIIGLTLAVILMCNRTAENRRQLDLNRVHHEQRTAALLENASDAVLAITSTGEFVYASASVRSILGYEPDWLTSERLAALTDPETLASGIEWIARIRESAPGQSIRLESRLRHADGCWIDVEVIGANWLHDPILGATVLSIRDVTARKSLERELTRQSFEDALTGMPNRALFHDRAEHALARHQRDGGWVTLLLIDLDDFKTINDSLGHGSGDLLIRTIAERLHAQVRPSDTLARLGGDEFAVLVENLGEFDVTELADRLLTAVRQPVTLGGRELACTASIGVASAKAGAGGPGAGELLRDADLAMYAAKGAGRDRYALFDPAMHADALREADDRADLERALAAGEFAVYYQPIVDLPTSRLSGVEALVRWQHPERGLLGPDVFIPLAEATGLIVPLGRWVLERACAQLADWRAEFPAAGLLRMSVNLSPRQFQDAGLVDEVSRILRTSSVPPAQVVLEITESLLMHDTDATLQVLHRLKALGIRLAIDDFGTGYSSLSYLERFPVDILKIDRAFVKGIVNRGENATIAEAVVQLARALRLLTVAEGIETAVQWSTLQDLGCDLGQGFLFARPAAAGQISALLATDPERADQVMLSPFPA